MAVRITKITQHLSDLDRSIGDCFAYKHNAASCMKELEYFTTICMYLKIYTFRP